MSGTRKYSRVQMWNEADEPTEDHLRKIEEMIDQRRNRKKLADCELPNGFRLVNREPKQIPMEGQLRWAFVLAWAPKGKDEYFSVHRYEQAMSDEVQMGWAIEEFSKELQDAGVSIEVPKSTPVFDCHGYKQQPLRFQPRTKERANQIAQLNRMMAL